MINNLLINFAIYVIIGICCFIWTSIGNDYVFKKIKRLIRSDSSLDRRENKYD